MRTTQVTDGETSSAREAGGTRAPPCKGLPLPCRSVLCTRRSGARKQESDNRRSLSSPPLCGRSGAGAPMQGSFASNWTNSLRGGGNRETGQAATRRRQRAGSAGTQRQPSAPASAPLTAREPTGKNVLYADPYSARGEGEARPSRSDTAEAAIPWRPAPRGAFEVEARDVAVTNAEPPSLGAAASVDNLLYSREAALRERLRESEGEARTLGDQVARWDALRERLQRAEDIERNRAEDERARAQQREQARQAAASRSPPAPRAVRRGWGENTAHTGNGREEPRRTGRGGPVEAGSGAPGAADALPSSAGMFGLAVAPKGRGGPPLAPALLLNGPSPRRRALSGDAAVTDAVGTSSPHGRLSPTAMSRSPSRRASGRLRPLVPPPDAEDGTAGGGAGGSLCVQGSPATPGPDEEPRSRLARMQRSVSHSVVPTGPPPRGGGDSSGASASPAAGGRPAPPTRSRSPVRSQGRIGRRTATPAGDARGLCAQGQALRLGSMAPAARHAFMRRWSALRRLTAEMGRASRGRQILELSRTASASSARHPDSAGARGADWLWGGNPPQAWAAHEEDTAAGDGESGGGGGYSPEAGAGLPPLDLGALRSPPRAASTLSRTASMDSARSQVEACAALAQCTPERVLCKMGSAMLDHLCDEVRHHVAGVDEGREGEGESGDDGEYGVDMGDEDEEEEEEEDSATEEGRSTESDSYTEPGSPPPSQADDDNGHRHDALASLLPDPAYHEAEGAGGGTDHAGADPAPRRQHSAALPARLQLNEAGMGLEHHSGGTPSGERGTPVLLDELGTPVEMRRRMAHGGQQGREREEEDRRFQATGVDRREGEEEKAEEKAEGDEDETPSMRLRMRASGLTREAVEASAVLRNQPPGRVAAAARKVAHDRGERGAVGEGEAQSSARRRRRGRGRRESAGGAGGGVARQLVFERVIGRGASGKVHLARLEPLEGEGGQGAGPEWVAVKQVSLRDSSVQALDEVLHLEVRCSCGSERWTGSVPRWPYPSMPALSCTLTCAPLLFPHCPGPPSAPPAPPAHRALQGVPRLPLPRPLQYYSRVRGRRVFAAAAQGEAETGVPGGPRGQRGEAGAVRPALPAQPARDSQGPEARQPAGHTGWVGCLPQASACQPDPTHTPPLFPLTRRLCQDRGLRRLHASVRHADHAAVGGGHALVHGAGGEGLPLPLPLPLLLPVGSDPRLCLRSFKWSRTAPAPTSGPSAAASWSWPPASARTPA